MNNVTPEWKKEIESQIQKHEKQIKKLFSMLDSEQKNFTITAVATAKDNQMKGTTTKSTTTTTENTDKKVKQKVGLSVKVKANKEATAFDSANKCYDSAVAAGFVPNGDRTLCEPGSYELDPAGELCPAVFQVKRYKGKFYLFGFYAYEKKHGGSFCTPINLELDKVAK